MTRPANDSVYILDMWDEERKDSDPEEDLQVSQTSQEWRPVCYFWKNNISDAVLLLDTWKACEAQWADESLDSFVDISLQVAPANKAAVTNHKGMKQFWEARTVAHVHYCAFEDFTVSGAPSLISKTFSQM